MIGCSGEMLLEVLLRQFCCLYSSRIGSEGSSQGRTWTAHVTLSARGLSARFHRVWLPHFAANASLAAVATRKSCRNGCEWGLSVACALTGVLSCCQRGCLGNRCSQPRCVSGQFCVFFRCHVAYRPVTGQYTATLRRVAFSLVAAGIFSEELSATSLDMPGPWFWWTLDGPFCWSFGGKNKFEIYRPGP